FFRIIRRYEPQFGALASRFLGDRKACPEPAVIYHTFEDNRPPDMETNDPRRNLITPLGGVTTAYHFEGYASSNYVVEYDQALEFDFLVDSAGAIHITFAPHTNLLRITAED